MLTLDDDVGVLIGSSGVEGQDAIRKGFEYIGRGVAQEGSSAAGQETGNAETHLGQRHRGRLDHGWRHFAHPAFDVDVRRRHELGDDVGVQDDGARRCLRAGGHLDKSAALGELGIVCPAVGRPVRLLHRAPRRCRLQRRPEAHMPAK